MFDPAPPEGIDPDRYVPIVNNVTKEAEKLGLYITGWNIQRDIHETDYLVFTFAAGKVAFSDRIQDPERDKMNDEIRGLESGLNQQDLQALRESIDDDLGDLTDEA